MLLVGLRREREHNWNSNRLDIKRATRTKGQMRVSGKAPVRDLTPMGRGKT